MKRKLLAFLLLGLFAITTAMAQNKTITGRVVGADDGLPLPGVSVRVKGGTVGTSTSTDGNYSLSVPSNATTLTFTYIGYATQEVNIGSSNRVDVRLLTDAAQLSEVVVIGYGVQSKALSTQAVSTVSAEAFKNVPMTSPQQLLQGQAAGVQMTNSSGVLGAASSIRIRGASSITGGGQPLFVVDGVPLNDGSYSSAQGGGSGLNPLLNINANDIESMTVLKDAAAVGIYGSRGSNGVVLIKTKSGSLNKKTAVSFDYFTGVSEPTSLLKYMTADEFRGFVNDSRTARGLAAATFPTTSFDWVDAVVQTGETNSYNLSAAGGDSKTRFFVGGNFNKESAFVIGNDLARLSGRFNFDHNISDNIKVGVNYNLSRANSDRIGVENNTFAPLTSSYLQLPYVTPFDANNNFRNTGFIQNVLAIEALNINDFNLQRSTGNAFAEFRILKDFKFKTDFGIDNIQTEGKSRNVNLFVPGGTGFKDNEKDYKWLTTNTLNYDKVLNNHTFGGLLGYSFETSRNDYMSVGGSGFASDRLPNVGSASTPTTTFASGTEWALESQFARLSYNFKNKYLFQGLGRRDGSSRFGENQKFGLFYALSAGWVVSEESFLKDSKAINNLKFTASYGTSGNDRIGNFSYQELFGGGVGADYNGNAGLIPTQVPNSDLSWEETAQFDVGVSTTLFNVFDIEANYYIKRTNRLLAAVPYPYTTGYTSATVNVGEMDNKGVDLLVTSRNINKTDFRWTTSLNVGFVKNEVKSLPTNKDPEGRDFLAGSGAQRAIVGESLNTFYMVRYKGINPATGDAEWLTKDGAATTTYSPNNRVVVGSAIPDFTGGFTNNLSYKGVDLNVFFNFAYGNKVLIDGLRFTENVNTPGFNKSTDLLNYWKKAGDNAFAPRLSSPTAANFQQLSTLQLQDGSYLRLKTASLGYTIPPSVIAKSKILANARIYVLGQNLITVKNKDFRGPDPEVSANGGSNQILGESFFALPQARTLTFGINLGF
ncbi:MAG: TonB-dependent receptor [Bacteroidota bacterium]